MILIADDDPAVCTSLALLLKQAGYETVSAVSPGEALAAVREEACALVLQDMNFSRQTSGEEGLALLAQIKLLRPALPVVLITAWGSIALAVAGMKAGAADFVTKPWTHEQVLHAVRTALGLAGAASDGVAPVDDVSREELDARHDFGELTGRDPKLLQVLRVIGRVAATDASVLVTGESGTGKELVAEALHRNSRRAAGPFVKVNAGGIPPALFESEMFGHVRGAFTDAKAERRGRFEVAHGGTMFLDEVGDLDPAAQVKLLRVLQDRSFEVLGSSQRRTVDVRIVSATHRPLAELVTRGEFREDLLYRINLIALHLPALRERPGDIPLLAGRFLRLLAEAYGRDGLSIAPDGLAWLQAQPWPGNVRQLRQWLERAALVTPHDRLGAAELAAAAAMGPGTTPPDPLPAVGTMTLDEIEAGMVRKALRHHAGNLSRVAEALGLSRAALYRRLEKYGIRP